VSAFIDERRDDFGVEPICRTLDVSASGYYERRTGCRSARAVEDERLLARIRKLHKDNYEAYGSRRMWKTLQRAGEQVARCTVERLMSANGIQGAKRRGRPWRTTKPDPDATRRPDLVERDFTAEAPNRLWVCDLTYLRTWEGLIFLAFVIDVFSRMVVAWQIATHMRTSLVLDALRMALGMRTPELGPDVFLVHHSDRGSQYTSTDYTQTLDDAGVAASLGSTGDAYDNALAESFVDSLKTELIRDRVWRTRDGLELGIVEYLGWFNNDRLHSAIGDVPPVEFEAAHATRIAIEAPYRPDGSPAGASPRASDRLPGPRPDSEPAIWTPIGADRADPDDRARPAALRPTAFAPLGRDQPTTLKVTAEEAT
jgi:putative transposase